MTIEEAKKHHFRKAKHDGFVIAWNGGRQFETTIAGLVHGRDFPTRAEMRAKTYWIDAATARQDASVAERKAKEATEAARLARIEGYRKAGGRITPEQAKDIKDTTTRIWHIYPNNEKTCVQASCAYAYNLDKFPAYWDEPSAEEEARKRRIAWRRENQTTPITPEQAKDLRDGDEWYRLRDRIVDKCVAKCDVFRAGVWLDDGCNFTSRKAAEAALSKSSPVPPKEEYKFPEVPSWCPPLLEGDVPLGYGGTFKRDGTPFNGIHATDNDPDHVAWNTSAPWQGDNPHMFYAAPRTSAIAMLNYPWLAEEAKAEPVNTTDKWIERKNGEEPQPTDQWTWNGSVCTQAGCLGVFNKGADQESGWVRDEPHDLWLVKVGDVGADMDGKCLRARYLNPNYNEPEKKAEEKQEAPTLYTVRIQWAKERVAALKAIRSAASCSLVEALHEFYEKMPCDLARDLSREKAEEMVKTLAGGRVNGWIFKQDVPVASHETPSGEPQTKEVSTDETQRVFSTGARRDTDDGKPRIDLIAPEALIALGRVLADGAKHYGVGNWENGIPLSEFLASMMRHYVSVKMGDHSENHDEKMLWNAMAFVTTAARIRAGKLPAELDDIGWTKKEEK